MRNVPPDAPLRAPVPKFEVPVTVVRLMPFVPPVADTDVKVALRTTPFATIAPPEPELIVLLLAPVVMPIVPPPLELSPVPLVVVIARPPLLKLIVAPALVLSV